MKKIFLFLGILSGVNSYAQQTAVEFANFKKYATENKAMPASKTTENRVVFMGNSITEGWENMHPDFFKNNPYINRGISGQTTSQMLLRFRRDVINLKPKAVTFLAGINDIAENTGPIEIEDVYGNIISMVELAQANNIIPIICSTLPTNHFPWREHINPTEKVMELNNMLKTYANQHSIIYIDYYTAMVDDKKGLSKKLASDGVHPTSKGYDVMEPMVQQGIKKALK